MDKIIANKPHLYALFWGNEKPVDLTEFVEHMRYTATKEKEHLDINLSGGPIYIGQAYAFELLISNKLLLRLPANKVSWSINW